MNAEGAWRSEKKTLLIIKANIQSLEVLAFPDNL
jgi:hypothetical protein